MVELVAADDGVVCGRMECADDDIICQENKTKTVSWHFLDLPTIEFLRVPMILLNIKTIGYSIFPNLYLSFVEGNEDRLFDTRVRGDQATLRLLRPVFGPAQYNVTLLLLNRDFTGTIIVSRHITHVCMWVSEYHW